LSLRNRGAAAQPGTAPAEKPAAPWRGRRAADEREMPCAQQRRAGGAGALYPSLPRPGSQVELRHSPRILRLPSNASGSLYMTEYATGLMRQQGGSRKRYIGPPVNRHASLMQKRPRKSHSVEENSCKTLYELRMAYVEVTKRWQAPNQDLLPYSGRRKLP